MSLCSSYFPDYFSITDILATQERLSCKIEVVMPRLGFLDVSSESPDLKPGTKLEIPFWLAHPLNARRRPAVTVEIPKTYKEGYREILEADACAVELSKWNLYYYEFGMYLTQLNHHECEKIAETLLKTFKTRFRIVMDWALNSGTDPTVANRFPVLERGLFLAGSKAKANLMEWLEKGGGNIEASAMVANHKKRKRAVFEGDNN